MIQTKDVLKDANQYMFSAANILIGYTNKNPIIMEILSDPVPVPVPVPAPVLIPAHVPVLISAAKPLAKELLSFTPYQKDKLFWCFYIFIYGYEEYEMNRSNSFSIEKRIKIEAVEKLKTIKEKLKELKLKRTELENELVNQPTISVKGLCALCLIYDVSIAYIYGRKYCELNFNSTTEKKGIIAQNEKKEDSLRCIDIQNNVDIEFYKNIQKDYWFIENTQKPLKASSAYTIKELQDISSKLLINLYNDKQKFKTKTKLYEEIIQH
jgi:hypothetical protein